MSVNTPANGEQSSPTRAGQAKDPEFRIEHAPYEKRLPSCAECRRLKRRCDRKWPCQSCIARGCASICPNGSLTAEGTGSRSILRKLKEMSKRIGQLEDALSAVWTAKEEHPLLRTDLLKVKSLPESQADIDESTAAVSAQPNSNAENGKEEETSVGNEELASALDTLTLGMHGKMNYMGRTAKEEYILKAEELDPTRHGALAIGSSPGCAGSSSDDVPSDLPSLPHSILELSHSFLLTTPISNVVTVSTLKQYLPPYARALTLVDAFFSHAGWFYSPMSREEFVEEVLEAIYRAPVEENACKQPNGAHDLALLFMVLTVGLQVDLSHTHPHRAEEVYHTLAKAALGLEPLLNGCSLALVQTLNMMIYRAQWDHETMKAERQWAIGGLASKMALTLGLHRDCEKWNLPPREVNRRRSVYWELFSSGAWASLGYGRPPSLQLCHTDCEMPTDPLEKTAQSGKILNRSFPNYKHHFTRDCLWPIIEQNYNLSKGFNYASVLALDRKVREFDFGNIDRVSVSNPSYGLLLQRYVNRNCKEHVNLFMHRVFFSRALMTNPDSPLDSPYASSVLATFKCAASLLQDVEMIYEQVPARIVPIGLTWSYTLTSAIAMGTICTKGPRGPLAQIAFDKLNAALNICSLRFAQSPRAAGGIPMLQNLQYAARQAIASVGPGPTSGVRHRSHTESDIRNQIPKTEPQAHDNGLVPSSHTLLPAPPPQQLPPPPPPQGWANDHSLPPTPLSQFPHHHSQEAPVPLPTTSSTLVHQTTRSNRGPGQPIQPDDYVWLNEPIIEPPAKRYRYADPHSDSRLSLDLSTAVARREPPPPPPPPPHVAQWDIQQPQSSTSDGSHSHYLSASSTNHHQHSQQLWTYPQQSPREPQQQQQQQQQQYILETNGNPHPRQHQAPIEPSPVQQYDPHWQPPQAPYSTHYLENAPGPGSAH